ncbi:MAG TPA: CpaF family protein [Anaerolineales bacterium]|nr:CpaF family protein [Anaerolineales bacterium]
MWQQLNQIALTEEQQERVVKRAIESLRGLDTAVVRNREQLRARARGGVLQALQALGWNTNAAQMAAMVTQVVARVSGLGFLDDLLRPEEFTEIALNPDGSLFVQRRDARYMEPVVGYRPTVEEAMRVAEALAGMVGQQLSIANPTINGRLRRDKASGFGGARVKILHPILTVGDGSPAISVRLFYPRRVLPQDLIDWGLAPEGVIQGLLELVARRARIMIVGGTTMGKTTLLSALCDGIPREARIIKVEDPEEIFLDHPNVITIEPYSPSWAERETMKAYTIADALADVMRMRPDWLIVGEVRRGDHVMNLLRAQLSGHPGMTSLHAFGPEEAVQTIETLVFNDLSIGRSGTKSTLALAVDVLVYLDWADGKRRIMGVWEVDAQLHGGNVKFRQRYAYGSGQTTLEPIQRRLLGDMPGRTEKEVS